MTGRHANVPTNVASIWLHVYKLQIYQWMHWLRFNSPITGDGSPRTDSRYI